MTNKTESTAHQSDGLAWMKDEYNKKEALLQATFGQPVDPAAYNDELFHGDSSAGRVVVWTQAGHGQHIHVYHDTATMLDACAHRRDAAVAPCAFFRDVRHKSLLRQMHALTVDLDGVAYADVMALVHHGFMGLMPTYVVNSGRGLHLVFLFDAPVECYDWSKKLLERMLEKIKMRFDSIWLSYRVDRIPGLIQIYRVVGSRTKLGTTCTAYHAGAPYTVDGLAAALGVTWCRPQPRQRVTVRDHSNVLTLPNGRASFYTCVRDGIIAYTQRGHRHTALFALGVVAAKCRINADVLQADARRVQQAFNARDPHDKVPTRDVTKALASVDPRRAKTVKAATLESWLGWSFERKTKRNGRTRAEHLALVADARTTRSRDAVAAYMDRHPDATVADVAAATGLSRPTATRYRREILQDWQRIATACTAVVHSEPAPTPPPAAVQTVPDSGDHEEHDKRQLATVVASIMDPLTDQRTRVRLLHTLPPTYREIVAGWLS